ncbi:MAG TPA: PQQ-dependent sugar dehydrogenase [Vicinamibacteria bacterium]|nr:PQQ-dependent sugar dehydrogenase [Vicinamibacteria bacterium]
MRLRDDPVASAGLGTVRLGVAALSIGAFACNQPAATSDSPEPTASPTASCSTAPVSGAPALRAELVATALEEPVDLQSSGDRSRLFVVERAGRIRLLRDGALQATPFLDIRDRVQSEVTREQGLLGLAFHPRFAENGRFFVNYTSREGETHIAEFRAAAGADSVDPATERTVLLAEQPFSSHCGGQLRFGPDGLLYIALGDGGSAGDPLGNAQSLGSLLGKILRIDIDGTPYVIPSTNPFVLNSRARREIWALGLRNPWRFAFDGSTGDLVIADVGQRNVEEIDVGVAARHGGENYGWAVTEGSACFPPGTGCSAEGLERPVVEYTHSEGCAVTGGVVYRGCRMPGYAGTYFYGDFCRGFVRSFRLEGGHATDERDWTEVLGVHENLTSFGTDAEGEVYMLELGGSVYKIGPAG